MAWPLVAPRRRPNLAFAAGRLPGEAGRATPVCFPHPSAGPTAALMSPASSPARARAATPRASFRDPSVGRRDPARAGVRPALTGQGWASYRAKSAAAQQTGGRAVRRRGTCRCAPAIFLLPRVAVTASGCPDPQQVCRQTQRVGMSSCVHSACGSPAVRAPTLALRQRAGSDSRLAAAERARASEHRRLGFRGRASATSAGQSGQRARASRADSHPSRQCRAAHPTHPALCAANLGEGGQKGAKRARGRRRKRRRRDMPLAPTCIARQSLRPQARAWARLGTRGRMLAVSTEATRGAERGAGEQTLIRLAREQTGARDEPRGESIGEEARA